ncbi:flagellar export chaperone FliS [Enterococcus sp.]|uniref:flagellar export chaperone FliS n=1 Tax=Enterococcus sp. TaxID=35783 RepID=UPI0025C619D6|nr:flagellar export chaperone FliS [Enterococcus sp.]
MNYQQMQSNYLKNQVMSASPNKLIEMLLQAAIKNTKLAQLAIEKDELAKAHEHFIKTQNILLELRTSLDEKQGGEIAENLAALYEYMYQQLIEANIKKEAAPAQAVMELLTELLESWQTITQSA